MTPRSDHGGFTLVEVMVSITILSLVMLATISAMRTFANTQQSLDVLTERIDEVRTVSGFLRDALEGAVISSGDSGGLTMGTTVSDTSLFKGEKDSLIWKAPILFGEAYGGVYLVRLAKEKGELVLRWQESASSLKGLKWSGTSSRVLVDGVEEFASTFREDVGEDWLEEWDREDSPSHARMLIKVNGRYWPDLILKVQR